MYSLLVTPDLDSLQLPSLIPQSDPDNSSASDIDVRLAPCAKGLLCPDDGLLPFHMSNIPFSIAGKLCFPAWAFLIPLWMLKETIFNQPLSVIARIRGPPLHDDILARNVVEDIVANIVAKPSGIAQSGIVRHVFELNVHSCNIYLRSVFLPADLPEGISV
jgi:hypothetical protein